MNRLDRLFFLRAFSRITRMAIVPLLALTLFAGCTGGTAPAASPQEASSAPVASSAETASSEAASDDASAEASANAIARVVTDLKGNELEVPMTVDRIISLAPSTTDLLLDLGLSDKIIAVDTYSETSYADDLPSGIPSFDMMNPDNEQIVALNPDIVFTTGMSAAWGEDVFASAREAGVFIIDIESQASLQEIVDSIVFIGDCVKERAAAEEIAADMEAFLDEARSSALGIATEEPINVLFELSTPTADFPTIYSVGPGSYIDEILTLVGAVNIASDTDTPWPVLTEEAAIEKNPTHIITTDNYTPDVVQVILSTDGWENVAAVQERNVYLIDADRINRPNHHVCESIVELLDIFYPGVFEDLESPFDETLPNAA